MRSSILSRNSFTNPLTSLVLNVHEILNRNDPFARKILEICPVLLQVSMFSSRETEIKDRHNRKRKRSQETDVTINKLV